MKNLIFLVKCYHLEKAQERIDNQRNEVDKLYLDILGCEVDLEEKQ